MTDRTGKEVRTDDEATKLDYLLTGLGGGSSTALGSVIERQEARGQRAFLESDTLPIDGTKPERAYRYGGSDGSGYETMEEWLARPDVPAWAELGFELGPQVPGDDLFRYAKLPPGWTRAGTDHSMHSTILDERGRERVGVFYKAAFYDRSARAHVVRLEGPNGKAYADHDYVPETDPRYEDHPMCQFQFGDAAYPSKCYKSPAFRWHHAEADVPRGDEVPSTEGDAT